MKYFILVSFLLIFFYSNAQFTGMYIENSCNVYVQPQTIVFVDGNVEIESSSTIENEGTISLTEDWVNNSGNTGLINDLTGSISFIGGNQSILGSSPTRFYNLNLLGGVSTKELFQDATVTNSLDLSDAELVINQNIIQITNPNTISLTWNAGYISGDSIGGYIARSTNSTNAYEFPVGNSALNTSVYRGVIITPTTSDSMVFGVRLAGIDPSLDNTGTSFSGATGPYDIALRDPVFFQLNDQYYHHISRFFGSAPTQVDIYYFDIDHPATIRKLNIIGQWNSLIPTYQRVLNSTHTDGIFGPNNFGTPNNVLSFTTNNFTDDIFTLGVRDESLVFVPQIFSPNGDGNNDELYVRGGRITDLDFIVYNRWGQKVFESKDKSIGWDGMFKGEEAQSGVYVYYVKATVEEFGEYTEKGNITLVR